jgi:hypothetical protein
MRALVRAHRWKQLLEDGKYRSAGAEAEGITRSFVNRILRLTLLAPGIVEAILGLRNRRDRFGKAFQAVDDGHRHVLEPGCTWMVDVALGRQIPFPPAQRRG